jgi:REP element-mobilizing transposase RayT
MDDYESLSQTKWEYKYHVVFIPKYRRKVLYGESRLSSCLQLGFIVQRSSFDVKISGPGDRLF